MKKIPAKWFPDLPDITDALFPIATRMVLMMKWTNVRISRVRFPIRDVPVLKTAMIKRAELVAANVMFQVNSSKLTKNSYPGIRELADSLKANPDLDLVIEGHTDNTGSPAYNLELSRERADAVKKALLKMGIEENRIEAKGFGDTKPIADNHTVSGRAKNRRVVFVFHLKNR